MRQPAGRSAQRRPGHERRVRLHLRLAQYRPQNAPTGLLQYFQHHQPCDPVTVTPRWLRWDSSCAGKDITLPGNAENHSQAEKRWQTPSARFRPQSLPIMRISIPPTYPVCRRTVRAPTICRAHWRICSYRRPSPAETARRWISASCCPFRGQRLLPLRAGGSLTLRQRQHEQALRSPYAGGIPKLDAHCRAEGVTRPPHTDGGSTDTWHTLNLTAYASSIHPQHARWTT